jgi:hypothetical protein
MDDDAITSLLGLRNSTDPHDNYNSNINNNRSIDSYDNYNSNINTTFNNTSSSTNDDVIGNEIGVLLGLKNSSDANDDFGTYKGGTIFITIITIIIITIIIIIITITITTTTIITIIIIRWARITRFEERSQARQEEGCRQERL